MAVLILSQATSTESSRFQSRSIIFRGNRPPDPNPLQRAVLQPTVVIVQPAPALVV